MRNECSNVILVCLILLYLSMRTVQGKPVGQHKDITTTIKSLRYDMQKVLHFIEHLNQDVQGRKAESIGDKSRAVIPHDQRQLNHLLSDESVIKATAKQAAQAVANSARATLKTQKGVKQIAEGLAQLKNCLEEFEKTIKL